MLREDLRNIAIIAHVDHGKTTLVDQMLRQSGTFRENQVVQDRVMDSGDLEKERGITILSKNTAVIHNGKKINIIDTPGHADFGGEVERVLKMVNGVVLVVDAFEGPMPQTKFVLKKAFELNLPVIVCINKIDRPEARPVEVVDEVLDLFIELGAEDEALEAPFIFASAKKGYATNQVTIEKDNMDDLFDAIIEHIPAPESNEEEPLQLLISTIDYNDYVGRIGIGKIERGTIKNGAEAVLVNKLHPEMKRKVKIGKLYEFIGLDKVETNEQKGGAIVAVTGIEDISIGDTIADPECPEALDFVKISEPTISMNFIVNDSPFAGREGKYVTSRQIKARLEKELQSNVSLRVEETDSTDAFKVSGRGELHLSVLVETMRREEYELQLSKPQVLFKTDESGKKLEPMEKVTVDVSEEFVGAVIDKLSRRKAELQEMKENSAGYSRLIFKMPARGLIGYRSEFMTDTHGEGIINSIFLGYEPYKGEIPTRTTGSLIAFETGVASSYGLNIAQGRGILFIGPQTEVYEGMVVGENPKGLDIEVNVTKKKQMTNTRAAGSDDAIRLSPPRVLSLEEALEFIEDDELIEVTPKSIRIRKKILDTNKRYKSKNTKK